MPLLEAMMTNHGLTILRPSGRKGAGDRTYKVIVRDLSARVENRLERIRTDQGIEHVTITNFQFFPHDAQGEVLNLQQGDRVNYTDHLGQTQERDVDLVEPRYDAIGNLDHIAASNTQQNARGGG